MSIKAGQILHDGNGFVIDRIQTGGVSGLNIPEEKIYELGNYQTVATVRDIPDLTFEMESLDVSTEVEALLHGQDPTGVVDGDVFDFVSAMPLDVVSPFKAGNGAFNVVRGIAVPYLTLENATYRFGVRQNSTQSFTLRGDSIMYAPGTPKFESFSISGVGPYTFSDTPTIPFEEAGSTLYAWGVCLKNPATGAYKRLFFDAGGANGYTNTATNFTLQAVPDAAYTEVHVVYGTTAANSYPQTVHEGTSVKPATVRGKDIDVYVSSASATTVLARWSGVQSVEVTRSVSLDNDEEFGNAHYVAQDYDTADVTGNVTIKPTDPADLWEKIAQVANVATNEAAGALTSAPLALEIRVYDPDDHSNVLKTLYVPDARFQVPAIQGTVQQKLTTQFNFTSDGGVLEVYQGARP